MAGEINLRDVERLEKKLDFLTTELKQVGEQVIKLSTVSQNDRTLGETNSQRLDFVENSVQQQHGALKLVKIFSGLALSSAVGFATWLVTDSRGQAEWLADLTQKTAIIETRLARVEIDLENKGK